MEPDQLISEGRILNRTNQAVASFNEVLKEGLGEVPAKYRVFLSFQVCYRSTLTVVRGIPIQQILFSRCHDLITQVRRARFLTDVGDLPLKVIVTVILEDFDRLVHWRAFPANKLDTKFYLESF